MQSDRRRGRRRRRRTSGGGDDDKTRVLLQYESSNNDGRRHLLKMLGQNVILDSTPNRGGIIIAEADEKLLRRLEQSPHIKQMEIVDQPAPFLSPAPKTSADGGTQQRHLQEVLTPAIQMVQADQLDIGPNTPLVCIADSGYALGHPDLPVPPQVDGMDYAVQNGKVLRWYHDGTGHGTATAGVIAAIEGNGIGYRGVAPELSLFITRALDDNGRSDVPQLMGAIEQCVASGAKIISMSLGCPCTDFDHCRTKGCYSELMKAYFASINENGVLVFGAAGNEGTIDQPFYPGSYESVISVGGVNQGWDKFSESSAHSQVELAAMGEGVRTTFAKRIDTNGDGDMSHDYAYTSKTGTSIAVPAVAASAALLWSHFPECTNNQIRTALARTAWNPNKCDDRLGFGIVQVKDAYDLLSRRGCELDGQIFAGASSACDGYATLTPTAAPAISTAPTQYPTAAQAEYVPPKPFGGGGFDWWVFLVLVVGTLLIGFALYVFFTQFLLPRFCNKKKPDAERRESSNRRSSRGKNSASVAGRSSTNEDMRKSGIVRNDVFNEDGTRKSSVGRNSTSVGDDHRRSSHHRSSTRSSSKGSVKQNPTLPSSTNAVEGEQSRRKSSIAGGSRRSTTSGRSSRGSSASDGPLQSKRHTSAGIGSNLNGSLSPKENGTQARNSFQDERKPNRRGSLSSSASDGPLQSKRHTSADTGSKLNGSLSPIKENGTPARKSFQDERKPNRRTSI